MDEAMLFLLLVVVVVVVVVVACRFLCFEELAVENYLVLSLLFGFGALTVVEWWNGGISSLDIPFPSTCGKWENPQSFGCVCSILKYPTNLRVAPTGSYVIVIVFIITIDYLLL